MAGVRNFDVIVVGGGMIGSALAWGLVRAGLETAMLDEGDDALRAARGNFGLVWIQGKGLGLAPYAEWSRQSADLWPGFAAALREETGIDVALDQPGGLDLCLGEAEIEAKRTEIAEMTRQSATGTYACEIIDRGAVQELLPGIALGEAVSGASWSPLDGHVNPLLLLRALHDGFQRAGGGYFPGRNATGIGYDGKAFKIVTARGQFSAPKLVLAAGLGNGRLTPQVGLHIPIRPERGQILVTERTRPVLPLPTLGTRQTAEGSFLMGSSDEDVGFDDGTTLAVMGRIAARAVSVFPMLAGLRLLRCWGALRILTPDGFPVYAESPTMPGAFAVTSHSGVTLAAVNALRAAPWIAGAEPPPGFDAFAAGRFDVPATA